MDLVFQNLASDPRLGGASKRYNSKFFEKILIVGIKELKLSKKSIGVSVNLVGEAKIKQLNKKYRHKNKATDVISFPMNEKSVIRNSKSVIRDIGDIFLCLSFAKKQAKSENVSIDRKLAQLTVHGFLHLLGYDHEKSEKEEKKMFNLENLILSRYAETKNNLRN